MFMLKSVPIYWTIKTLKAHEKTLTTVFSWSVTLLHSPGYYTYESRPASVSITLLNILTDTVTRAHRSLTHACIHQHRVTMKTVNTQQRFVNALFSVKENENGLFLIDMKMWSVCVCVKQYVHPNMFLKECARVFLCVSMLTPSRHSWLVECRLHKLVLMQCDVIMLLSGWPLYSNSF